MAQSVIRLTLAQVMISRFVSSSPTLGSVLTAKNLESALDSVSPSLSLPLLPPTRALSLSINKNIFSFFSFSFSLSINKDIKKQKRECIVWGAWVAQSVEHPTLDFGSVHDPRVLGSSAVLGSKLSVEPA